MLRRERATTVKREDHRYFNADMSRRRFLGLAVGAAATGALALAGCDTPRQDENSDQGSGDPSLPKRDIPTGLRELTPRVRITPLQREVGDERGGVRVTTPQTELTPAQELRLKAPVFTLTHTVIPGENVTYLASRYYDPELVKSGHAVRAILAANEIADPNLIQPEDELYIPISEPVVEKFDGANPLEQAAKKYGFSVSSLRTVNEAAELTPGYIYVPKQAMPKLEPNENLYITEAIDMSYFGIAQKHGYNLPTLLGRNRPPASNLEHGHILITRNISDAPKVERPTIQPDVQPAPLTPPTTVEQRNRGKSAADLRAERSWDKRYDLTLKSAEHEQKITIAQLEGIKLTPEGYKDFVKSINSDFAGAFEDANTIHPDGVLNKPDYFIQHHTAYGYKKGDEGVQQFIQSMINQSLSVQWLIDREGKTYQLVRKPKQACNHAYGVNGKSTGVEIMTDDSWAQGSITDKQLTSALYLAYYVTTEVYKRDKKDLKEVVVGHREIDDRIGTLNGKPDFFKNAMDVFRSKLDELARQIR